MDIYWFYLSRDCSIAILVYLPIVMYFCFCSISAPAVLAILQGQDCKGQETKAQWICCPHKPNPEDARHYKEKDFMKEHIIHKGASKTSRLFSQPDDHPSLTRTFTPSTTTCTTTSSFIKPITSYMRPIRALSADDSDDDQAAGPSGHSCASAASHDAPVDVTDPSGPEAESLVSK